MGVIIVVIVGVLLIAVFAAGHAIAGTFCKNKDNQLAVGILLGFGILFVIAGIAFAGCVAYVR